VLVGEVSVETVIISLGICMIYISLHLYISLRKMCCSKISKLQEPSISGKNIS
jgi:hypothetical protein